MAYYLCPRHELPTQPISKIRAPIAWRSNMTQMDNGPLVCKFRFSRLARVYLLLIHVGVLTKPDRIPSGEEDRWLRFIRGEAESLTNGWFTVRQPATKDLEEGMTWERAREQERLFFSTTSPWSSDTDWSHRFGTNNLTESLSKILSDLIKRR